jgi:hypothetical protein
VTAWRIVDGQVHPVEILVDTTADAAPRSG